MPLSGKSRTIPKPASAYARGTTARLYGQDRMGSFDSRTAYKGCSLLGQQHDVPCSPKGGAPLRNDLVPCRDMVARSDGLQGQPRVREPGDSWVDTLLQRQAQGDASVMGDPSTARWALPPRSPPPERPQGRGSIATHLMCAPVAVPRAARNLRFAQTCVSHILSSDCLTWPAFLGML